MTGTILLVEDSPESIELTKHALEGCDTAAKIVVAHDGQDAVDYIFSTGRYEGREVAELPDVVLLDLRLPKVDGFEVLEKIRSNRRTRFLPVVMLTVSRLGDDIRRAYELGANSYIVKSIDYDVYNATIRAACAYWLRINTRVY